MEIASGPIWVTIVLALISFSGVVYTVRQGRKSADKTAAIEATRADAESYETARENWQAILSDMRADSARQSAQIDGLVKRVDDLERREDYHVRRFSVAVSYIKELVSEMRKHNVPVPAAPQQISVD